jgi:hypothetical protein
MGLTPRERFDWTRYESEERRQAIRMSEIHRLVEDGKTSCRRRRGREAVDLEGCRAEDLVGNGRERGRSSIIILRRPAGGKWSGRIGRKLHSKRSAKQRELMERGGLMDEALIQINKPYLFSLPLTSPWTLTGTPARSPSLAQMPSLLPSCSQRSLVISSSAAERSMLY